MRLIGMAERLGAPGVPTTLALTSSWTEGEKCLKNEAKSPIQSVSNLSMNGSEPRPRTVGNLSLHEQSDVHNRAGTAPAAPPGNSALSGPSGTCRAQQRARQKPDQELTVV